MDPIKKIPCELAVADVLQTARLSPHQLSMAYIISGCDDASISIKNFGWKKAVKFLEQTPDHG
jgi:hypothetical protein